jgi:hypothetical protein
MTGMIRWLMRGIVATSSMRNMNRLNKPINLNLPP